MITAAFDLHPQLAKDTWLAGDLQLCRVLLMNDARYPWLILVPRLAGLTDLHQLPAEHRATFYTELQTVSEALENLARPFKLNVAALGNMVPQLHIHVIARTREDAAWPGPVWGVGSAEPYPARAAEQLLARLRANLFDAKD